MEIIQRAIVVGLLGNSKIIIDENEHRFLNGMNVGGSQSDEEDLQSYIADNYGECTLGSHRCYHGPGPQCLSKGWRGRACPYWQPVDARNWDELKAVQAKKMDGGSA